MLLWSLVPSEWDQALKIFHWADRHGGLRVGVWGWGSPVFKPFGRNYPVFQSISWRLDRVVALASTFLFCVFSIYVLMHLYSIYRKVERWMHHIHHAQSGSTCFNHEPCRGICVGWQGGVGGWSAMPAMEEPGTGWPKAMAYAALATFLASSGQLAAGSGKIPGFIEATIWGVWWVWWLVELG